MKIGRKHPPDGESTPAERFVQPLREFAAHDLTGAALLIVATIVAVVWANSPWAETLHHILESVAAVSIGDWEFSKSIHHWINDGLMGIFFFLVGLEIKREILVGELSTPRKATLPIAAALGGMAIPAACYLLLNRSGEAAAGWGVPMATDIAFALGILLLLGSRVPASLKIFLTALAIVDDIGAILVIAFFYTDEVGWISLAAAGVLLGVAVVMNLLRLRNPLAYFVVGTLVWLAFVKSGVHATLAAVLMAFTIPAQIRLDGNRFLDRLTELIGVLHSIGVPRKGKMLEGHQQDVIEEMDDLVSHSSAPLQRLEHGLAPFVHLFVLPVFALANAGVTIGGDFVAAIKSPIFLGVVLGLFVGKQLGVFGFAWAAVKLGFADLPKGVTWRQVHGVSILAGVGFTMSLFIGNLAFTSKELVESAKLGILVASALSAVVGLSLLHFATKKVDGHHGGHGGADASLPAPSDTP